MLPVDNQLKCETSLEEHQEKQFVSWQRDNSSTSWAHWEIPAASSCE